MAAWKMLARVIASGIAAMSLAAAATPAFAAP